MLNLKKFRECLFVKGLEKDAKKQYRIRPTSIDDTNTYCVVQWTDYGYEVYNRFEGMSFEDALEALLNVRNEYIKKRIQRRNYFLRSKELDRY